MMSAIQRETRPVRDTTRARLTPEPTHIVVIWEGGVGGGRRGRWRGKHSLSRFMNLRQVEGLVREERLDRQTDRQRDRETQRERKRERERERERERVKRD